MTSWGRLRSTSSREYEGSAACRADGGGGEIPDWWFILTTGDIHPAHCRSVVRGVRAPARSIQDVRDQPKATTRGLPVRKSSTINMHTSPTCPKEYKLALLEEVRVRKDSLTFYNYNPRVIEHHLHRKETETRSPVHRRYTCENFSRASTTRPGYCTMPFLHQISEAARHLLFALTTLPEDTKLEFLEEAFRAFYEFRRRRFGFPTKPGDGVDALRELDGNFIKTGRIGKDIAVSFHNPSIGDFMEQFLEKSDGDVLDLLRGAHFYEQYLALWRGIPGRRDPRHRPSGDGPP